MTTRPTQSTLPSRLAALPSTLLVALFGLALTALLWVYVEGHLARERAAEVARVHRDNDMMARAFEEHVRRVLQSADDTLLFLEHEYEEYGMPTAEFSEIVERTRQDPLVNQVAVADAAGDLVVSAVPLTRHVNIAESDAFRAHAEGRAQGLFIGRPVVTKASGTWSIIVSRRLEHPDGTFAGAVALGLDPAYFTGYYEALGLGPDRGVILLGRDGIVRARRFQRQSELGQDLSGSPMFSLIPREPAGHYETVGSIDGLQRFVSYRALPDLPLIVAVSDLSSSALAPVRRRAAAYRLSALIITLFVAAFYAALAAAGRRERRQTARLAGELAERRRAEEALREASERHRDLFENASDAIFLLDAGQRYVDANRRATELFGYAREEFLGHGVLEFVPPEQAGRSRAAFDELTRRGGYHGFEGRMRTKDGRWLDIEVNSSAIVRDGALAGSRDIVRDVTERHLLEKERLKTQKLESLGTLAGGIAHDFNNLLQGIFGYISLAKLSLDRPEKTRGMIEEAEKALHQSVGLTTQLLTFSRGGRPVRVPTALAPVIENAVKFALSGSRAVYRLALDPGLRPVDADAGQIAQVIQNIVINADQAMPRGGCVEVAARNVPADDPGLPQDLPRREHVSISIADTGVGIPEEDLARIFDPYFTTKERGSGLGLATCYSIVRNHDGRIVARSSPGAGSTFVVYLPASSSPTPRPAATPVAAPAPPGDRAARILVMDDEEVVRNVAGELLAALGCTVTLTERGEAALEAYRAAKAAGRPFDGVILDLTIRGGMGGVETLGRLREIDPGVRAVASSGYSDDAAPASFREEGFAAFLKKPYRVQELRSTLDALLG